ncbi:DUF4398 domain-containing protein [Acidovorax sp. NCPPB 3576]|uniref:DUF4398 domain-containing protein n=1 Tax=Acidovorax sp. NCPPB 3576 TaxID=2940488 RepID=UPI00234B0949|nr:DUF4398 domain-containing protein [Acidovorax sp. NCPPB 3576]WCM88729.1 DUF4398 domain-containing protein [Acidovorax sp. NCPPB 3576]
MPTFTLIRTATAVLALGALAACSSTPKPTEQMAVSRTAVDRATTAPKVAANAPVELQSARDKWTQAQQALDSKDYTRARRLAAEAEADARVAETKAEATDNAATLQQVKTSIQSLQEEITRRAPAAPGAMPPPPPMPAPMSAPAPMPGAMPPAR